jgi:polyisoprenoid-binding protein YceI
MTTTTSEYVGLLRPDLSGDYQIDPAHSRLGFVARHAMVTKVRGQFTGFEGTIHADASDLPSSSVTLKIDVSTVNTGNEMRDQHLRTNDFFDIENHPTITFSSTSVEIEDAEHLNVTGELTIRGITKTVTIPLEFTGAARDAFGNDRIGFEGSLVVNRKDFGVNWNAPLEAGGVLVSEKVTLELDISAVKVTEAAGEVSA